MPGPLVVLGASTLVLLGAVRSRKVVNGLQTLIAKGRKNKNRSALVANFAPVHKELVEQDLKVTTGAIPAELRGVFMRNGSNPYYDPYASYHWFEGDGMLHALRISGPEGKLTYANSWVRTSKLAQEKRAGKPIFAKFGDQEGVRGLLVVLLELWKTKVGIIDVKDGTGTANTSVICHANRILALHEGDLPYQVRMACSGVLETLGRVKVGEEWGNFPFTAHPKLDAASGELHFLGYDIRLPMVQVGTLSPKGELLRVLKVPLPYSTMLHDMAITKNYAVLLHLPLCFEPEAMIKQNSLPIVYRADRAARIGLLPLGATSPEEVRWFELPSFMSFHVANAWEEDGQVKVYLCVMKEFDMSATTFREDMGSRMSELTLDLKTGAASLRQMSTVVGDFPVAHPNLTGRKTQYAWTAANDVSDTQAKVDGIAKFDLFAPEGKDACVGRVTFPKGCYGGEAFFTPRHQDPALCDGEDDGFLATYVYHEQEDTSYFEVYDAKTMSSVPLAQVRLPQRVPYGFHSTFIPEAQLKATLTATAAA